MIDHYSFIDSLIKSSIDKQKLNIRNNNHVSAYINIIINNTDLEYEYFFNEIKNILDFENNSAFNFGWFSYSIECLDLNSLYFKNKKFLAELLVEDKDLDIIIDFKNIRKFINFFNIPFEKISISNFLADFKSVNYNTNIWLGRKKAIEDVLEGIDLEFL